MELTIHKCKVSPSQNGASLEIPIVGQLGAKTEIKLLDEDGQPLAS